MSQTTQVNSATSAFSLAAITVGAVAAAVVIMSIGSIVTIISIGTSFNSGMQTASNFLDNDVSHVAVLPTEMTTGNMHKVKKPYGKKEKGFYIDAVLREDSHTVTPANVKQNVQPKLSVKGNHVFANIDSDMLQPQLAAA